MKFNYRSQYHHFSLIVLISLALSACEQSVNVELSEDQPVSTPYIYEDESILELTEESNNSDAAVTQEKAQTEKSRKTIPPFEPMEIPEGTEFKTVEWTDLMPKEDLDALLNPPSYVTEVEDGSVEDQISSQIQNSIAAAKDDRYQQALSSTKIIEEMNGKAIRIPGFIVPLEFDDEQTITQFFLVPFFGACIHVPPPPPNQIIFVNAPQGLKINALYDPIWISGVLKTTLIENDLATSAYSLQMQSFEFYDE